jgi:hypothetical protein
MTVAEGDDVQLFLKIAQVSDLRALDAHTFEQFIQFVFKRFGFTPRLTNADSLNIRPTRVHLELLRADVLNATALVVNGAADMSDVTAAVAARQAKALNTAFLVTTEQADSAVRDACSAQDIRLIDAHGFTAWIDKSKLASGPNTGPSAPVALPFTAPGPTFSQLASASARAGAASNVGLGVLLALNSLGLVIALGVVGLTRYSPALSASQTATVRASTPSPTATMTPTRTATPRPIPTIKLPATAAYREPVSREAAAAGPSATPTIAR